MPRPCKRRRVCAVPRCARFGPVNNEGDQSSVVIMAVDEFESIRLIDLEGLTQEECAQRMGVARTTAQAIYNSARRKLAECLVHEKELHIQGGEYVLCEGDNHSCERRCNKGCRNKHHTQHTNE